MPDLPYVDEHVVDVAAPPDRAFAAVERATARLTDGSGAHLYARVVRCEPPSGFGVEASEPPQRLVLAGRHLFSTYRLTFAVDPSGDGSRLTAITHAAFPGLRGQVYKTLVIRSGAHRLITRQMLRSVAARA